MFSFLNLNKGHVHVDQALITHLSFFITLWIDNHYLIAIGFLLHISLKISRKHPKSKIVSHTRFIQINEVYTFIQ